MKKKYASRADHKFKNRLLGLLSKFKTAKILSLGDLILDAFIWGSVDRISPEAPVPVVNVLRESFMPGGNLNVANNIRTLGGTVYPCGILGRDLWGRVLLKMIRQQGIDTGGIVYDPKRPTTLKTRVIAHSQQVVRFDRENSSPISPQVSKKICAFVELRIEQVDCLVIEDYGKGMIVPELLKKVISLAKNKGKHILVDPKQDHISYYKGVTSMTPNFKEALVMAGLEGKKVPVEEVGKKLLRLLQLESILITLGEKGMMLFEKNGDMTGIPTAAREVFDVSGAGDTVIAVFALALAAGAKLKEAAVISNLAAGIVVGKVGTACVSQKELEEAVKNFKGSFVL